MTQKWKERLWGGVVVGGLALGGFGFGMVQFPKAQAVTAAPADVEVKIGTTVVGVVHNHTVNGVDCAVAFPKDGAPVWASPCGSTAGATTP